MPNAHCYIGTSGWSYPHWAKGRFYPKGLKPGDWLAYLADHFDTVEINSSFYRLPKAEMIDRWRDATPARFRFAVKLWRLITHQKKLLDCERALRDFLGVADRLERKRGPLLVQLPPSQPKDPARLDDFLGILARIRGRRRWKVAVEFRNREWICDETRDLLTRRRAALVLADMPRCPVTEPNDTPFVYVRRHGPGGRYRGRYTPRHIVADARRIRAWLAAGRDVYVYYNNDIDGYAVDNARQLREVLSA